MKKALVILFDKVEEVEALAPIDILRRARVDVVTASLHDELSVVGRSGVAIDCDAMFEDAASDYFDAVILPGGPGTYDHIEFEPLINFLKKQNEAGRLVAAICAAPVILEVAGVLKGRRCTGHPSVAEHLENYDAKSPVVADGNVITSQGAGTAIEFALSVLEFLKGSEAADEVAKSICFSK